MKALFGAIATVGFLILYGTAGYIDFNHRDPEHFELQIGIGIAMFAGGAILAKMSKKEARKNG